jgi:hypothetical protein
MMTPKGISARDRRMAAVHEAGHIVIARALGFEVWSAWIGPNTGEVVERTWIGHVRIAGLENADDVSRRMVGVAGSVAAHLWCGGTIEDFSPDAMSRSDWYFAGCDPNEPDDALMDAIGEVGRLLARDGPIWQELIAESRRLILASRPST